MNLLAISYPELSEEDFTLIEDYRKRNDRLFNLVKPHFTFVFPVNEFSATDFITEINTLLSGNNSISFSLRSCIINKDAFNGLYHAFLIPDEGFNQIVNLHDKLYSGKLKKHHRFDIDYIPHITVGSSEDKQTCQKMADEWNLKDFSFNGIISSIDIVRYENDKVETIETISLL